MTRMVQCKKLKAELPGLARPPLPGPKGQEIYDSVSQKAWMGWLQHQTMLINEKRLNLSDPDTQKYLMEQMDKYFSEEEYEKPEGYVPPEPPTP